LHIEVINIFAIYLHYLQIQNKYLRIAVKGSNKDN